MTENTVVIDAQGLLDSVKALWPKTISLRGYRLEGEGAFVPALVAIRDRVDASSEAQNDVMTLGCWAFYQSIWRVAKDMLDQGIKFVDTDEVGMDEFRSNLQANLTNPCWAGFELSKTQ